MSTLDNTIVLANSLSRVKPIHKAILKMHKAKDADAKLENYEVVKGLLKEFKLIGIRTTTKPTAVIASMKHDKTTSIQIKWEVKEDGTIGVNLQVKTAAEPKAAKATKAKPTHESPTLFPEEEVVPTETVTETEEETSTESDSTEVEKVMVRNLPAGTEFQFREGKPTYRFLGVEGTMARILNVAKDKEYRENILNWRVIPQTK